MRRPLAFLLVIALAIPFASAFGQGRAACCCKGATACALKLRAATCATSCSMGKAETDVAPLPKGAARQAMMAFNLESPFASVAEVAVPAELVALTSPAQPDPPPPRA